MVSAVNLNGGTIADGAGNAASVSLTGLPQGSPQIDTTAPTVASVTTSGTGITAGSGNLSIGSVVTLTVNLSEAVTVAGGIPTLSLNDGGVASYASGSGTNALTFTYTVAAGQTTADLAVTAVNLGTATVTDAAGNSANWAGAVTNPAGILQINPPSTIESLGSTSLVQVGNNYFLDSKSTGTGPELMYGSSPWGAGQAWTPIGVEKTSNGYEVALFNASNHLYTIWNADNHGSVLWSSLSSVSGTNIALESIETSFQQDLNGDGTIGAPTTTIESSGSTSLLQLGNNYFLDSKTTGTGPELMYGSSPWGAGQAWTPIGVEKTSTGYEVALFNASNHLYTIWNADNHGSVLWSSL